MRTELKLLGCANRGMTIEGIHFDRWFYTYFAIAENGLVDTIEVEDYVEDGIYDIDYFDKEESYEDDLLGSTTSRCDGPSTQREVCEIAAYCWT